MRGFTGRTLAVSRSWPGRIVAVGAGVTIMVAGLAVPAGAATYDLRVSTNAARTGSAPLSGATVAGNIYVFTSPTTSVKSVSFWIDNPAASGTPYRVEGFTPFDLNGGSSSAATAFNTLTLPDGAHSITQVVTTTALTTEQVTATFTVDNIVDPTPGSPSLSVTNPDGFPSDSVFVFSRIGGKLNTTSSYLASTGERLNVHDRINVVVNNTGDAPGRITALAFTGDFRADPAPALPLVIPAGGSAIIPVQFIAVNTAFTHLGSLKITTNDTLKPTITVQLRGLWMLKERGTYEPKLTELINNVFGLPINIGSVNNGDTGTVRAAGDEVLSPFWKAADPSQPVTVQDIAETRGGFTATLNYYERSVPYPCAAAALTPDCITLSNPPVIEGQKLFPRNLLADGVTYVPAKASFTPTGGFGINWKNREDSDDSKTNAKSDLSKNCVTVCGHHMRFYPLKTANGTVVPNAWVMAVDFAGGNYDYNDIVAVWRNMTPDRS